MDSPGWLQFPPPLDSYLLSSRFAVQPDAGKTKNHYLVRLRGEQRVFID
jgi:hypothetical protein